VAARSRPWLAWGWFWYLVTLLPVAGFVQVGAQARADRYTYLPLVGITTALVWLLAEAAAGSRTMRRTLAAGAAAAVSLLAATAFRQAGLWRDGVTLYRHTLASTGANPIILYNLGNDYRSLGHPEQACAVFQEVLRIDPRHAAAANNIGDILFRAGRPAAAAEMFKRAVRLEPGDPVIHFNLGMACASLGLREEALAEWRLIRAVDPERALRLAGEIASLPAPPGAGVDFPAPPPENLPRQ
jgi:tetratricopeptide (TPR) repeat protein